MTLELLRSMSPIGSCSMKETSNADLTLFAGGFGRPALVAGLAVFCSSAFGATTALLSGMLSYLFNMGSLLSFFTNPGVATLPTAIGVFDSAVIEVLILLESANIYDKSF